MRRLLEMQSMEQYGIRRQLLISIAISKGKSKPTDRCNNTVHAESPEGVSYEELRRHSRGVIEKFKANCSRNFL